MINNLNNQSQLHITCQPNDPIYFNKQVMSNNTSNHRHSYLNPQNTTAHFTYQGPNVSNKPTILDTPNNQSQPPTNQSQPPTNQSQPPTNQNDQSYFDHQKVPGVHNTRSFINTSRKQKPDQNSDPLDLVHLNTQLVVNANKLNYPVPNKPIKINAIESPTPTIQLSKMKNYNPTAKDIQKRETSLSALLALSEANSPQTPHATTKPTEQLPIKRKLSFDVSSASQQSSAFVKSHNFNPVNNFTKNTIFNKNLLTAYPNNLKLMQSTADTKYEEIRQFCNRRLWDTKYLESLNDEFKDVEKQKKDSVDSRKTCLILKNIDVNDKLQSIKSENRRKPKHFGEKHNPKLLVDKFPLHPLND